MDKDEQNINEELEDDIINETEDGTAQGTESTDEDTLTGAEVNKIIEDRLARQERKLAAQHKKELDEAQSGDLTEVQKLEKQLNDYKAKETQTAREKEVRQVFDSAAFAVPVSDDLVKAIVREDEFDTQDNAEAVANYIKNVVRAVKKEGARQDPPKDPSAISTSTSSSGGILDFARKNRLVRD